MTNEMYEPQINSDSPDLYDYVLYYFGKSFDIKFTTN